MKIYRIAQEISDPTEQKTDLEKLNEKISEIIPNSIAILCHNSSMIKDLIQNGKLFNSNKIKKIRGYCRMGYCHKNVNQIYKKYPYLTPCTGLVPFRKNLYGGIGDPDSYLWIDHSWLVDEANNLYEPTPEIREYYFGITTNINNIWNIT